jgi:hypothetical protein
MKAMLPESRTRRNPEVTVQKKHYMQRKQKIQQTLLQIMKDRRNGVLEELKEQILSN